jgi:hypothetical protein
VTAALHTLVVALLLAGYVVLSALGHDADALLGVLAGYIGGAGAQAGAERAKTGGG